MGLLRRQKKKSSRSAGSQVKRGKKTPKQAAEDFSVQLPTRGWVRLSSVILTLAIAGLLLLAYYVYDLPDIERLNQFIRNPSIEIVTADGELLGSYGHVVGEQVTFDSLPPHVVNAVLATEDRRFFSHWGVDPIGLARAIWVNMTRGGIVQGGSTITQQVVKNVFLTPERTLRRKIQEVLLAFWMESTLSKEEIFSIYVNRAYLGAGNYGIDAAAHRYFGKPARKMSVAEAALIAGMLKAPSRYAPTNNPELARKRAEQAVANMVDAGMLSEDEAAIAKKDLAQMQEKQAAEYGRGAMYFADWVVDQIPDYVAGVEEDLVVTVTLRTALQEQAEKAVTSVLDEQGAERHATQAAALVMRPDGAVLAMVGGRNYNKSQFNRATQALRQPGSAFKLFVFLAALEEGFTPGAWVVDRPVKIGKWSPGNYNGKYAGEMTLRDAFAESINTVAVQVSEAVGREKVVGMARKLGISTEMIPIPSIALGVTEVTLLQLTAAYAHMASEGRAVYPYAVTKIANKKGKVLYERKGSGGGNVLTPGEVGMMNDMLMAVTERGTGRGAAIGRPIAGKTGTSQDFRDAWFIGFTPQMVTGVWVGNDNNSSMKKVTGGSLPAKIWHSIMQQAMAGAPVQEIPRSIVDGGGTLPWIGGGDAVNGPALTPGFWQKLMGGNREQVRQKERNTEQGTSETGSWPEPSDEVEYEYPSSRKKRRW